MKHSMTFALIATALIGLSACQKEEAPAPQAAAEQTQHAADQAATAQPAANPQPGNAVSSEDLMRKEAPAQPAQGSAIQAIQSKPYNGTTVHLTKAKVVGPILTVEFVFEPKRKPNGEYDYVDGYEATFGDLSYIDEASAQKVGLLQDENGKFSASPTSSDGKKLYISGISKMTAVTLKYPAPPATTQTISIDLPKVGSFDSIPVTR
ncbi:phosphoribosylglycinamide synthetase [Neisseria weixii]|uniref:Phosphoribosylglycinamide synthetase n=1 Tax=Neisseria weixii TaxID=1853276 RepID=A0A3N4MMI1_9NEIS|nr:phosphoribosylglycinamide synthetase [Neisseria weixii]RPD84841.1 phosphoribosylglycinamide synthetase [Neisseria weixii]RPD85675.1 phosphoribosylglycinamide synthetase [Neisseria weixii]